jgi:hypothetical protein
MEIKWICSQCGLTNITTTSGEIVDVGIMELLNEEVSITDWCECDKEVEITIKLNVEITGVS